LIPKVGARPITICSEEHWQMMASFLNHCHPKRSANERSDRPRCHEREAAASAKQRSSLNHCHPERIAKERSDGARVEGPRFPQHHHDYVREFTPHELIDGPPRHRKREAAASAKPRPSSSHCHPERSEKERSDGARVEGPAFLRANTTTSGNPHRCTRTSSTLTTNPCQCRACLGVDFLYTY
jgi:hypothetical protein